MDCSRELAHCTQGWVLCPVDHSDMSTLSEVSSHLVDCIFKLGVSINKTFQSQTKGNLQDKHRLQHYVIEQESRNKKIISKTDIAAAYTSREEGVQDTICQQEKE